MIPLHRLFGSAALLIGAIWSCVGIYLIASGSYGMGTYAVGAGAFCAYECLVLIGKPSGEGKQ